jgi:methyl-accepting chemotaxis protein
MFGTLQNMRIKTKLLLLCCIMLMGFIVFGHVSFDAVEEIEVNGPIYNQIIQGKNLIADILPPPAYILESYLTVIQLREEPDPDKRALLIKKVSKLRRQYFERHEYWCKTLPDGPMRNIIAKTSHDPAEAFYAKFNNEFLPALVSNNTNKENAVEAELGKLYQIHRKAIDELVHLAQESNSAGEVLATSIIRRRKILLLVIACGMMAAIVIALLGIRQILTTNVLRLVSATEMFSAGNLQVRTGFKGKDEFSEVGRAFDQMAEKIERTSTALKKSEERLTRINEQLRWEIAEREQAEEERNQLIAGLTDALAQIKTLTGFLPICSSCKKIRNDRGDWEQMEAYIREHSDAEFSHGICPECIRKLYPDIDLED